MIGVCIYDNTNDNEAAENFDTEVCPRAGEEVACFGGKEPARFWRVTRVRFGANDVVRRVTTVELWCDRLER